MKYIFLGKPDRRFPHLVTGQIYDLEIVVRSGRIMIVKPITCPYRSWATFKQNWQPFHGTPIKAYRESFKRLDRAEEEMFKESKRLEIKHPSEFIITKEQYQRAEKSRKHLLYTIRQESAREKRITFAYYVFFLALLYAFVILLCAPW